MSSTTRKRPSPAMVVAVTALSFALVGSAYAGTDALKQAITKKTVKSIAKKQANKVLNSRESSLNVNNASTVDNKNASDLQTASGFSQSATVVSDLGTTFVSVAGTATVTSTAAGRVLATGSAELFGDGGLGDEGQCRIVIDGTGSLAYETEFDDIGSDSQATVAVNFARTLPAGAHTATLECRRLAGTAVGKDDAALNLYALGG